MSVVRRMGVGIATALIVGCSSDAVAPVPTTLRISASSIDLTWIGESRQLTSQVLDQNGESLASPQLTWTSSSPTVVSVSAAGLVTALAVGVASITAEAGDARGSVSVRVTQVTDSLSIGPSVLDLPAIGDTARIEVIAFDSGGTRIPSPPMIWNSASPEVATVIDGLATAHSVGLARLDATSHGVPAAMSLQVVSIVDCPPTLSGGDLIRRGFYVEDFPAPSLDTVRLFFVQDDPVSYTLTLSVRQDSYDGPLLRVSSTGVVLNPGESKAVDFALPGLSGLRGTTLAFSLDSGTPNEVPLFYDVGDEAGAAGLPCPVVQTRGTDPPLDTFRRTGVAIRIR